MPKSTDQKKIEAIERMISNPTIGRSEIQQTIDNSDLPVIDKQYLQSLLDARQGRK